MMLKNIKYKFLNYFKNVKHKSPDVESSHLT